MLEQIITWLVGTVGSLGYTGIVLLMALESSFFPFPSEVVMIPAGYLAHQGEMNIFVAIAAGTFGSLLGAWLNYFIAVTVGRATIMKWGHLIFLPNEKFARVENFLQKHGAFGTLIGRLLPVIRQYISFPAGLVRMPLLTFTLLTGIGAGLWVTVLALIGYYVGENQELVAQMSHTILFWVLLGCVALTLLYWKWRSR